MKRMLRILFVIFVTLICKEQFADPFYRAQLVVEELENLPKIRRGETIFQASSHDKRGLNLDTFQNESGIESYLYKENSEYFIFDEIGPGAISRIWMTFHGLNIEGNIKFYFDGETTPRIQMSCTEFFSGNSSPFLYPIVGFWNVSSGGLYSYYPIVYEHSLKISLTAEPQYYNITFKRYNTIHKIHSYPEMDTSTLRSILDNAGHSPFQNKDFFNISNSFSLPGNNKKTFTINEKGSIYEIVVTTNEWLGLTEFNRMAKNLWIEMRWDGHSEADVSCPFYLFFAGGINDFETKGLTIGASYNQKKFYCYFPMPFQKKAEISFINTGLYNCDLNIKISYSDFYTSNDSLWGYFKTQYNNAYTRTGEDFILLETEGTGHIVGCVTETGPSNRDGHLEGDERIYIDDYLTPVIYGTGTEDFYNGGWYFIKGGNFSRPFHGFPAGAVNAGTSFLNYRLFLLDNINFYKAIKFGLEHGGVNGVNARYKSVVYYYHSLTETVKEEHYIDIANIQHEEHFNYKVQGEKTPINLSGYYEGDNDDILISDNGYKINGTISFHVNISPDNSGVRLRRRMDYSVAHQKADVYVNNEFVGVWQDPGQNNSKRWRDSIFEIPPSYTVGRNHLSIKLDTSQSFSVWTEFCYWIYTYDSSLLLKDIKPPEPPEPLRLF